MLFGSFSNGSLRRIPSNISNVRPERQNNPTAATDHRGKRVADKAVHKTANSSKRHQESLDSDRCSDIDLNVPIEEYPGRCSSIPFVRAAKCHELLAVFCLRCRL